MGDIAVLFRVYLAITEWHRFYGLGRWLAGLLSIDVAYAFG